MMVGRNIISNPSPNFDDRGEGVSIDMLVLHYTGMQTGPSALNRLVDADSKVSAHYLIEEDGTVFELVAENKRAWHAGVSSWRGNTDINARSIGIEIVNPGHEFGYRPYPKAQMDRVLELAGDLVRKYGIPARNVVGHSDIAPDRKQDPGELFDWKGLAENGVGIWLDEEAEKRGKCELAKNLEAGAEVPKLQKALAEIGYDITTDGIYDDKTTAVVSAFQRHWRPVNVSGSADRETQAAIYGILDRVRRLT